MENKNIRIAIVPGSFDPITNGHIDIVKRAAKLYDKVYLAVMINESKTYMFTLEERTHIAEIAVQDIPNVEVISSEGYLWKLAKSLNACAIVKGIRNSKDEAYELQMAKYNFAHCPEAETVFLKTSEEFKELSSTVVREKILKSVSLDGLLPKDVIDKIMQIRSTK